MLKEVSVTQKTVTSRQPVGSEIPVAPDPADLLAAERAGMECTPLQMRRALRLTERKAAVDAYIALQTEEVQEAWEYALAYHRLDPFMVDAIAAMGTPEEGDDLFRLAMTL